MRRSLLASLALVTVVATGCPPDPGPGPGTTTTTTTTTTTSTTTTTLANQAPIADDDQVLWDLRDGSLTGTDLAANDADPDGDDITASGGGTFSLDGDPAVAGTFAVDPDGTLHLTAGSDPVGPIQQLRQDQLAEATVTYTVSDGDLTDTATVTIEIAGKDDLPVLVGEMRWPSDEIVDFNDPNPTLFDGSDWVSAEGYPLQFYWSATSSVTVPPHPAFVANVDVESFTVPNQEWGFNAQCSVQLQVIPEEGVASSASVTTSFFVTDAG